MFVCYLSHYLRSEYDLVDQVLHFNHLLGSLLVLAKNRNPSCQDINVRYPKVEISGQYRCDIFYHDRRISAGHNIMTGDL